MADVELVNVYEVRRRNLEILIAGAGSVKELGERMRAHAQKSDPGAVTKDYANTLSQYRNDKPMGARFARNLEESVGRPKNWMDVLQPDPAEKSVLGREAAQIVMSLEPEDQEAAMRVLRSMQRKKGPNNPYAEEPKRKGGTQ